MMEPNENMTGPIPAEERLRLFCGGEIMPAYASRAFRDVVWNKLYRSVYFAELRFSEGQNYEVIPITWKLMKKTAESGGSAAETR